MGSQDLLVLLHMQAVSCRPFKSGPSEHSHPKVQTWALGLDLFNPAMVCRSLYAHRQAWKRIYGPVSRRHSNGIKWYRVTWFTAFCFKMGNLQRIGKQTSNEEKMHFFQSSWRVPIVLILDWTHRRFLRQTMDFTEQRIGGDRYKPESGRQSGPL